MTFADHMLGWLVWDLVDRKPCATVALNSQFTAAVKPGDWVEMRGHVVRQTRSLIFVQGTLTVSGKTVLAAEGLWKSSDERLVGQEGVRTGRCRWSRYLLKKTNQIHHTTT